MRLRNVKNKEEILNSSKYLIRNPDAYRGKWHELFHNNQPIYVEIGMGMGKFIRENALLHPEINYIGIEKFDTVLAKALPRIKDLNNLYIIRMDATNIDKVFVKEIDKIYLNFSDPWPKKRHALRRLSSSAFLNKYDKLFRNQREIEMRTDNQDLFIYSLESFSDNNYHLSAINFNTVSLVTTEYEDKFKNKGLPIYSVKAIKSDK